MIPIWLALLLSWILWAIILFVGNNRFGFSFKNETALYIFCAPVAIPIFIIGIPIGIFIRIIKKIKCDFETKKCQKKKERKK